MQLSCKTDGAIYIIMPKRILHFIRESVRSVSGVLFMRDEMKVFSVCRFPKVVSFL